MFVITHDCDRCGTAEERLFTDTWTGKSLCLWCLNEIVGFITNSPASEKDNLESFMGDDAESGFEEPWRAKNA